MSELPQQIIDQGFEDTESVDQDIDNLFQRFIVPIDKIRSIAEAPPGRLQSNQKQNGINELNVNPVNFLESRVHAFYRLLGLPIVANEKFYNPGFDPQPKNNLNKNSIDLSLDQKTLDKINLREQYFKSFSQMFNIQGLETTLFALTQSYLKPFNMLEEDTKTKNIDGRNISIEELKKKIPNLSNAIDEAVKSFNKRMGFDLNSVRHILKPFIVNPAIDFTVMPIDNKVCVPFLPDLRSTKISANPDVFLVRPGLEFILRARLKDTTPDPLFMTDIQKIIIQEKSPNPTFPDDINVNTLRNTLEALADHNNITDPNVLDLFSSFTTTQVLVVKQLIKTLKVVIKEIHTALHDIEKAKERITFLPVSSPQGFEYGGILKDSQPTTKLERDLITLTIKKLNADRDIEIDRSLGAFATSEFTNLEKTDIYSQQITELTQLKNEIGNRGLRAIRSIEIISGEGSGLGLVDILAIYTALWTIKIEELLGFLDQTSFDRLYDFNVSLRTAAVLERKNGGGKTIEESLNALEKKVGNILSFADLIFARSFTSPNEDEGGDPT